MLEKKEKQIEHEVCIYAKKKGFLHYKFSSPSHRGVPDRVFMYKGRIFFIEFKRLNAKLSPLQVEVCKDFSAHSVDYFKIDNVSDGKTLIDNEKRLVDAKE